ncbi:MAG: hypothetical protein ACI38A_05560 [Candidatus Ornithomonoglobus sp.]
MLKTINPDVTISIDLKKNRIRIHKRILHLLGDPKYIQLLVNPRNKYVAIRGVEVTIPGDQTERINPPDMMSDCSYELYSRLFVKKLCQVAGNLEPNTYRLVGGIIQSHNMAVFSLKTLTRIEDQ